MGLKKYTDDDRNREFHWTHEERAREVVAAPILWTLTRALPERSPYRNGRPNEYDVSVYMLFELLTAACGSHRAAASWLGQRRRWPKIRKKWSEKGIQLPKMPPSRYQCLYNRDRYIAPHWQRLFDVFEQEAVRMAQEHGALISDVRTAFHPPRDCVVVGDATVPAMPMRKEALKKRRDAGKRVDYEHHTEGGNHPVDGTKFYLHSVHTTECEGDPRLNGRVVLSIAHVPQKGGGGEAGIAVKKLLDLKARASGMLGVRYDGALRGVHLDQLMKAGLSVVNPPHGGIGTRPLERVTCQHVVAGVGVKCGATTELLTQAGWIGTNQVVADNDATLEFTRLPRRVLSRWNAGGECRWYVEVTLPCGHPYRVRLTGDAADRAAGYNRAEHVRMHPRGSEIYAESYGWRNDSESLHSQLDLWLYRGRMIGLTLERQALVMLSFAVTINAIADWYAKHRDAERRQ